MYRRGKTYDEIAGVVIDIYIDYGIKSFPVDPKEVCRKLGVALVAYSEYDDEQRMLLEKKSKDGWTLHTEHTRWSLITLRFHTGSTLKSILKRQINLWTTSFIALMGNRSLC